jgi:hypothetical protein
MRKTVCILSVLFVSTGAFAGQTKDLQRVVSATTDAAGTFDYRLGFRAYLGASSDSVAPLVDINGNPTPPGKEGQCRLFNLGIGLGYTITDYLAVELGTLFLGDMTKTDIDAEGSGAVTYGLGDTHLGARFNAAALFSEDFREVFGLGLHPVFTLPTGAEREEPTDTCAANTAFSEPCRMGKGGLHRFYTAGGFTGGAELLFTYMASTEPEVPVHLNLGYTVYPDPGICSKYTYGIGAGLSAGRWFPFLEICGYGRVKSAYNDGGIYVTPGVRSALPGNINVSLSMDIRVTGEPSDFCEEDYHIQGGFGPTPPWAINLGVSQAFQFFGESGY